MTSRVDSASGDAPEAERKGRPFYRRPVPLAIIVVVLVAAVIGGGLYWLSARRFVSTENAFLQGDIVRIAARVDGTVTKVLVEENQVVDEGQLLARIDPSAYRVALAQARAERSSAEAQLQRARASVAVALAEIEQARAEVAVARARAENAAADLARYRRLDALAISEQKLDSAEDRADRTRAELLAAEKRLAAAEARVEAARADVAAAEAAIERAEAQIEEARLNLSYTKITAPTKGEVAQLGVEVGEYVRPGEALMSVVAPGVWVKANFKETQITHMRPGQPVTIHIDAYPGRTYHGTVASIQRATGAVFSLLPPQNATGNFIKVVQRVPVRIVFDESAEVQTLVPGLSVVPTVKVREWEWWPW